MVLVMLLVMMTQVTYDAIGGGGVHRQRVHQHSPTPYTTITTQGVYTLRTHVVHDTQLITRVLWRTST